MKSFINMIAVVIVLLAGSATAQEVKSNANPLPTFKTFYTFTNINYRNDISFTPVGGQTKGHLRFMGERCMIDQAVPVIETPESFVVELEGMTPKNVQNAQDVAFCTGGLIKVIMPKQKGAFGYQGFIEARMPEHSPFKGYFPY